MDMRLLFRGAAAKRADSFDSRLAPLAGGWLKNESMVSHVVSDDAFQCFRSLDNELLIELGQREFAIMLASASSGDGRSTIAIVLAALSAVYAFDQKVLYVDASGDAWHSQNLFDLPPHEPGLYDYLEGTADLGQVAHATPLDNLHIVPACSAQGGRRVFDADRFECFLAEARSRYDRVIVDAPPLETHREALSMARTIRNTLLVIRCCRTPRGRAILALRDLQGVGARLVGSVLNDRVYPLPGSRPT